MPKYYIESGKMKEVVSAPNIDRAAEMFVEYARDWCMGLGLIMTVSERGFQDDDMEDEEMLLLSTERVLKDSGLDYHQGDVSDD